MTVYVVVITERYSRSIEILKMFKHQIDANELELKFNTNPRPSDFTASVEAWNVQQ